MKKTLFSLIVLFLAVGLYAQNEKADNIIGTYHAGTGDDAYRIQIVRLPDGGYQGALCWLANPYDASGKNKRIDVKNPDKSLRNVPIDKVVLFSGLQYDAKNQHWSGAKIYDPDRGIRVKMTARFEDSDKLVVRGTVLGIGEKVIWTKE